MTKNKFLNYALLIATIALIVSVFCLDRALLNQRVQYIQQKEELMQKQITSLDKKENYTRTGLIETKELILNTLMNAVNDIENLQETTDTLNKNMFVDTDRMVNGSVFVKGMFGMGSGTVIKKTSENMYILTCYHVIADLAEMKAFGLDMPATVGYVKDDPTGKEQGVTEYAAKIIKTDKENDLALLKTYIVDDKLVVIKLAETLPIHGDTVYSVGNPLGVMRTLSRGILANHKEGFYFCDNTTTFGNSGGSLYNINGELIGVPSNVMGYKIADEFAPESSLGLSIDLLRIREFLKGEI